MCPKKFHTKILDVREQDIVNAVLLAGGRLAHARTLHTEWFFVSIEELLDQTDTQLDPRDWVSLRTSTPKMGVLSATTVETQKIGGQREVKVAVSQVDDTLRILAHFGHEPRTRLDWYSTAYQLGLAHLSVDEMPGGHTWLSITGPDAGSVLEMVSVLGYCNDGHGPLSMMEAYRRFGVDLLALDEVTFETPPQERL